jgi:hypothetical protein
MKHIAGITKMKNSYKTLARKPEWRKLLLATIEVNTESGFKNYRLKETPGFIWRMTGIAATKEEGEESWASFE